MRPSSAFSRTYCRHICKSDKDQKTELDMLALIFILLSSHLDIEEKIMRRFHEELTKRSRCVTVERFAYSFWPGSTPVPLQTWRRVEFCRINLIADRRWGCLSKTLLTDQLTNRNQEAAAIVRTEVVNYNYKNWD